MLGEWVGWRRYVISEGQLMGSVFGVCDMVVGGGGLVWSFEWTGGLEVV